MSDFADQAQEKAFAAADVALADIGKPDADVRARLAVLYLQGAMYGSNAAMDEARRIVEPLFEEPDPTPYCHACGAMKEHDCDCGPLAENE